MKEKFLFLFILIFLFSSVFAQKKDSVKIRKHSPTLATVMSAVVPGTGQIYNRKYWKTPIVWAGVGAILYFIKNNYDNYDMYKTAYKFRTDDDPLTVDDFFNYTPENLLTLKNFYRKNLELTCFIGVAIYCANILDAAVDANLFDFDVSDDLSINVQPVIQPRYSFYSPTAGLKLTFRFK
ncbi:MAG: DUF5683 domain-containing protein [Bacteroidales bacterium]|nr:DUF5683 domain-containing protein [Bacteroidales bacterium]